MSAWKEVRSGLAGAAIEIDQDFLREKPRAAADAIKALLKLTDVEADRIRQTFEFDHPERTSVNQNAHKDISAMGWGAEEMITFEYICAGTMASYGYSTDAHYYDSGGERNGLIWV